jgi:outer membrane lipoprotein-sorting protein
MPFSTSPWFNWKSLWPKGLLWLWLCLALPLAAQEALPPAINVDTILERHIKAYGGQATLDRINSLRTQGTITTNDRKVEFIMVKKRPDFMRMTVGQGARELIFAYDGHQVWRQAGFNNTPTLLENRAALGIRTSAPLFNPLILAKENRTPIEYRGIEEVAGDPCYALSVKLNEDTTLVIYLDRETYLESKHTTILELSEGQPLITNTYFDDFRPLGDLIIPHRMVTITPDGSRIEINVDEAALNIGVYDRYFWMPGWKPEDRPEIDLTTVKAPDDSAP